MILLCVLSLLSKTARPSPCDTTTGITLPCISANKTDGETPDESGELIIEVGEDDFILSEAEAILEVPAIPLYFPTSYSLVKPYVKGFDMNSFDAPSLKKVEIDSSWQPKKTKNES